MSHAKIGAIPEDETQSKNSSVVGEEQVGGNKWSRRSLEKIILTIAAAHSYLGTVLLESE